MIAYRSNVTPPAPWLRAAPKPPPPPKSVEIPASITDPLAREILEVVRQAHEPWPTIEARAGAGTATVRYWFYRANFNPKISLVQAVLGVLGYRLKLERIQ